MFALTQALTRRGHVVVLAGPPDFAGDAAVLGIDYRGMGRSMDVFLSRNSAAFHSNTLRLARAIKREVRTETAAQFDLLAPLARDADRVVGASLAFAAPSCAEYAGRPYRFIAFAPETFPSRHYPALGERRQDLPRWLNSVSWWVARRLDNWLLRAPINQGRARLGLAPIRDALAHFADPTCSLLATDVELAPAAPDVRVPGLPTGAMLLGDDGPLPEHVEAFLAAGPPPVYIGFGSMPDARPEKTRAIIAEAVRGVGCRAMVYVGRAADMNLELGPSLLAIGALPHTRLLSRVALAVHHGGAGTCARAARAGIPQVILPHVLDQFPWAARLARRGLAPAPLFRRNLTGAALAERILQALDDSQMRERAANLARVLAGREGADEAAAILSRP